MLKVAAPREPVWIELDEGARIQFRPMTTAGIAAGQAAVIEVMAAGHDRAVASVGFTIAAARWGAIAWEGVGDDAGEPLELTPANLQALLEQSREAYIAVDQGYVLPALGLAQEKKGSAPSLDGTSAASKPTKPARARPGAAGTTAGRAKTPAKSVPTN